MYLPAWNNFLLRALIDPSANQADLFLRQLLYSGLVPGRRHVGVGITGVSNVVDQHAFGAIAGHDHLAVLAALEHTWEAVEAEPALRLFRPVAFGAGSFEEGLDVRGIGNAALR